MSIIVDDKAGVFSPSHVSDMNSAGGRFPFEYHVVTGKFSNNQAIDDAAHACVSAPNVVCTVIDPALHHTSVHFGTATGVKGSDFNLISAAGNSNFKAGEWSKGVLSIGDRALESSTSAKGTTIVVQPVKGGEVDNTGLYVTGGLFIALVAGVGYLLYRDSKKDVESFKSRIDNDMSTFREEASTYRTRNIEEDDFHKKLMASAPKIPSVAIPSVTPGLDAAARVARASQPLYNPMEPVRDNKAAYFDKGTYKAKPVARSSYAPAPVPTVVVVDNSNTSYYSPPTPRYSPPPPPPPSSRKPSYGSSYSRDDDSSSSSSSSSWGSSSSSDSGGSSSSWDSSSSDSSSSSSDSGGGGSDW